MIGKNRQRAIIPCPVDNCIYKFYVHSSLRHHVTHDHGIKLKRKDFNFKSEDDFDEWKHNYEAKTSTQYFLATSRTAIPSGKKKFYNCRLQTKSNEINKTCTSRIEVAWTNDSLDVTFWTTHVHSFLRQKKEVELAGQHKSPLALHMLKSHSPGRTIPVIDITQKAFKVVGNFMISANKNLHNPNTCDEIDRKQSTKALTEIDKGTFEEEIQDVKIEPVDDDNKVCIEINPVLQPYNSTNNSSDIRYLLRKKSECVIGLLATADLTAAETIQVNYHLDKVIDILNLKEIYHTKRISNK